MNILDIILLICFVVAIFQGVRKGFIAQAISIISIVLGIWASARFTDIVTGWISQFITASEQVLKLVSFTIILVIIFLLLAAIGKLLEGMFQLVMLGWLNKLLGAVFALIKVGLIIGIIILAFNSLNTTFNFMDEAKFSDSILYMPLKQLANEVFPYLKEMLTLTK